MLSFVAKFSVVATVSSVYCLLSIHAFNPLASVTISSVGGQGSYGKVTNMPCPSSNTCEQTDFAVNGPLAPFDEDLTLALRGPMQVDNMAVFVPGNNSAGSMWQRVSAYSREAMTVDNLVFLNNKGDPAISGDFSMCYGNSQSYATVDGTTCSSAPQTFSGVLNDGVELNVMTEAACVAGATATSCGVARGAAYHGWAGNNKIFMVKARMPMSAGQNLPAIWLLNGQIVRTAQYGCNCRGMGDYGRWKGGCGELDVAEVIAQDVQGVTSTIYSFKGSRGTNTYAPRPVDQSVVYVTIFSDQSVDDSNRLGLGVVQILVLPATDVDFNAPLTNAQVQQWLSHRNGVQVHFDV